MKNIYCTSDSFEADMIVSKLSDNGINASCRQKENFNVVVGKNDTEFEIFVDDWKADEAKKLIAGNGSERMHTSVFNKRRMMAIAGLICVLAVIVLSVVSAIS